LGCSFPSETAGHAIQTEALACSREWRVQAAGERPQRKLRGRVQFTNSAVLFAALSMAPVDPQAMTIVKLDTLVRWHRKGFRRHWCWKSRNLGEQPTISAVTGVDPAHEPR
jgi:hypothetical protein